MMDKLDREIDAARARLATLDRDLAAARAYAEGLEKAASILGVNGQAGPRRQKLLPAPAPADEAGEEEGETDEFGLMFGETFVAMTEKQARLCEALSEAKGEIVAFETLRLAAGCASRGSLDQLVLAARRVVQPHGADIVSARGTGYFWTGPT